MKVRDYQLSTAGTQRALGCVQESRRESTPWEQRPERRLSRPWERWRASSLSIPQREDEPRHRGHLSGLAWGLAGGGEALTPSGTWCVLQAILILKNFKKQAFVKHLKGLMLDNILKKMINNSN